MNYKLIRPILFNLGPEFSHNFSLKAIKLLYQLKLLQSTAKHLPVLPKKIMGLTFENPVGLAAGLDKNGDYIDALGALGFGFIEIGTITPKPQPGNPKPRLFRLTKDKALINRMGFNNKGVDYLVQRLIQKKYTGILGINIGKNAATPLDQATDDYQTCLAKVYPHASYVTVNISSPNTPNLRSLQSFDLLNQLLITLKRDQADLANQYNRYVPLVIKIAPDISPADILTMASVFKEHKVDGIITTNTTVDRFNLTDHHAEQQGGLSGQPLFEKSTQILASIKAALGETNIPLIASGGIMSPDQARAKAEIGADLIQLYTGLIYEGPGLIASSATALNAAYFDQPDKKCQID